MSPYQRTGTEARSSLYGWWPWFDNNTLPRGWPAMALKLHSAAKPLRRLIHHKQALDYIAQNRHVPLSKASLEIYSSYLLCQHVSFATQRTVLQHLGARAYRQHDAVAILRSPILGQIPELLGSPDRVLRTRTSLLVGGLLAHNFSMEVMSGIIGKIIPMLREANDPAVQKALVEIATHPDCAQVMDTTNAFDRIPELLESGDPEVRWKACAQIESLVRDRPIGSILPAIPIEKLFGLLRDDSPEVVHESMTVLTRIAKHPDGAAAEVASPNFASILGLFESKIENMNRRVCWLVDALAKHDLILMPPQVRRVLAEKILNLLQEDDEDVRYAAMRALKTVFPYHPAGFPTWSASEAE